MTDDLSLQRWPRLATFPSVNGKAGAFLVLLFLTFLNDAAMSWYVVARAADTPGVDIRVPGIVEYLHDAWLLTLTALGGISLGSYITKRKTYANPSPDSERAGVPVDPPPSEPAPADRVTAADMRVAAPLAPVPVVRRPAEASD